MGQNVAFLQEKMVQTTLEPDNKLEFSRGIKDLSQGWLYLAFTTTAYKNTDMQKQQSFRDIHRSKGEKSSKLGKRI